MDLVIIGAGGHGRDCHQLIDDLHADGSARDLHLVGYVDDNPELQGAEVQGVPVLGGLDWLQGRQVAALLGIGYPKPRYAVQQRASELGITEWPTLVHPRAYVAGRAKLGQGVHIAPMAHIGPNVQVGRWTIVNAAASVGHDAKIGAHCLVAPLCSVGFSCIGEGVMLGQGVMVAPGSNVGSWSVVGANSVVLPKYPVPPAVFAIGSPAQPYSQVAAD